MYLHHFNKSILLKMEFKSKLIRFYLIIWLFSLHLSLVFAVSLEKNAAKRTLGEPRVLILGAGMAGIRAARTLFDEGMKDFLVLEASNRIGGRLWVKNLDEGRGTIELGANWVHGTENNPIWELVKEAGLESYETMTAPKKEKYIVYNENGDDVTKYDHHEFMETIEECLDKLRKEKREKQEDFTVRFGLTKCGWVAKNPAETAIEYYYHDFEAAAPPEEISSGALLSTGGKRLEDDIDSTSGTQVLISDRRGYASIISNMAEKFKDQVLKNHLVKKIMWDEDAVTVEVEAELEQKIMKTTMKADFVLVTFSIGVLQNQTATLFDPPLPEPFTQSLNKIKMANYLKIFMIFSERFWPPEFDYIFYASQNRGFYPVWQNLPGEKTNIRGNDNILLVTVTGPRAQDLKEDKERIKNELVPVLKKVFASNIAKLENDPKLLGIELKNWELDRLFLGAYSNPTVGTTSGDFATLLNPIGERLFFAGEGLSELYYGYLHGAYFTGQDQAKEIHKKIQSQEGLRHRLSLQKIALNNFALRKKIPGK